MSKLNPPPRLVPGATRQAMARYRAVSRREARRRVWVIWARRRAGQTCQAIADDLGLTKQRVSQIDRKLQARLFRRAEIWTRRGLPIWARRLASNGATRERWGVVPALPPRRATDMDTLLMKARGPVHRPR
jgi:hypothetical protein